MNKEWDWLDRQLPHGKRFLLLHFQKRRFRSRNKFSESGEVNLLSPHKSIPVRIYSEKQTPQNKQASKSDKPTLSQRCQIFETVLHTSFNSSFRGGCTGGGECLKASCTQNVFYHQITQKFWLWRGFYQPISRKLQSSLPT